MSVAMPLVLRPVNCWKPVLRRISRGKESQRSLHTPSPTPVHFPRRTRSSTSPVTFGSRIRTALIHRRTLVSSTQPSGPKTHKPIKAYPPPPTPLARCKDPVAAVTADQLTFLDPTGARTKLFSKANREAAKVGDILLVRLRNGDPFAGACLNIRRRGVDTGILLRNQLTRVGVEMWFKIYSPNVEGIEVVQRREKRARRARLYYMRYVPAMSSICGWMCLWICVGGPRRWASGRLADWGA